MGWEPGSNAEIKKFAQELYGAEFPLFAKTDVNGVYTCEAYKYLLYNSEIYDSKKQQAKEVLWNFTKFFVDSNGKVVAYYPPATIDELEAKVKEMLK